MHVLLAVSTNFPDNPRMYIIFSSSQDSHSVPILKLILWLAIQLL